MRYDNKYDILILEKLLLIMSPKENRGFLFLEDNRDLYFNSTRYVIEYIAMNIQNLVDNVFHFRTLYDAYKWQ